MRLRHPFEWLAPSKEKWVFLLFLALTLAVMASLQRLGQPLQTAAAPQGIISFELAGTLPLARQMIDSWGPTGQVYAGLDLGLDYLFLVAYANTIGLGCVLVADRLGRLFAPLAVVGIGLAWAQLGAAVFDAVENYALIQLLLGSEQTAWPIVARGCALSKFLLVGLGLVYVVLGAGAVIVARARRG